MQEQETGKNVVTKVNWGQTTGDADEKYRKCLEVYSYLSDPKYAHKQEQLYLMNQEGFSGKFIHAFFRNDPNIQSIDLDLIRGIALLAGETFAMQFYKKEFSLDEAREAFAEHAAREKYRQFGEIEKLMDEVGRMRDRFDLQMEFLKKEQETSRNYADALLEKEREKAELEKALVMEKAGHEKAGLEHERDTAREKLENVQSENLSLKQEIDALQKEAARMKESWECEKALLLAKYEGTGQDAADMVAPPWEAYIAGPEGPEGQGQEITPGHGPHPEPGILGCVKEEERVGGAGLTDKAEKGGPGKEAGKAEETPPQKAKEKKAFGFFGRRNKKEAENSRQEAEKNREAKKQRNDFIVSALSNTAFSKEQLQIILRSVKENLPIEALEQICVPEMPEKNMEILEEFYIHAGKRKEMGVDGGTKKNASADGSGAGAWENESSAAVGIAEL